MRDYWSPGSEKTIPDGDVDFDGDIDTGGNGDGDVDTDGDDSSGDGNSGGGSSEGDTDDGTKSDGDSERNTERNTKRDTDGGPTGGRGGGAGSSASSGSGGLGRSIPRDLLVLDLDADGVELTSLEGSNAYFDLNGDGFATRTAWLSGDDGFLALDRNADGTINDITELFGSPERTGYEELGDLNSNADGVIDASDERFADLRLWQDQNSDGVSQSDELRSLTEAGIVSVSLSHSDVDAQQGADGKIARQGTFAWTGGTQGVVAETAGIAADILLSSDPTFTQFFGSVEIDPEVLAVGNVKGYGQMPDLHIMMSLDSDLKDSVLALFESPTTASLLAGFEQLLTDWAGVNDITLAQTGTVDFRFAGESFTPEQLGIIKQYAGMDDLLLADGQWRENGQIVTTGGYYRQAYNQLSRNLLMKFAVANGLLSDVLPGLGYDAVTDLSSISTDIKAQVFNDALANIVLSANDTEFLTPQWLALTALIEINPSSQTLLADAIGNFVLSYSDTDLDTLLLAFENLVFELPDLDFSINTGTSDTDTLDGGESRDIIIGFAGDDTLNGHGGTDVLKGGAGADTLNGGDGDDQLTVEAGADVLDGGSGNDEYRFGTGYGRDRIRNRDTDTGRYDIVRLLDGITAENITVSRQEHDLVIVINGTEDVLRVESHFDQEGASQRYIDAIVFNDGSTLDIGPSQFDQINLASQSITEGDDQLHGTSAAEIIDGLAGNDQIYGKDGGDWLIGCEGNDQLFGDAGGDLLTGDESDDQLYGGEGRDYLAGGNDHDELHGITGDDVLRGDRGDDLLIGGHGNDNQSVLKNANFGLFPGVISRVFH